MGKLWESFGEILGEKVIRTGEEMGKNEQTKFYIHQLNIFYLYFLMGDC